MKSRLKSGIAAASLRVAEKLVRIIMRKVCMIEYIFVGTKREEDGYRPGPGEIESFVSNLVCNARQGVELSASYRVQKFVPPRNERMAGVSFGAQAKKMWGTV